MKTPRLSILVCFFCFSVLVQGWAFADTSTNNSQVTFESFLKNPPNIQVAEYGIQDAVTPALIESIKKYAAKEGNPDLASDPASFVKWDSQCWLRLDHTNFILNLPELGTYSG